MQEKGHLAGHGHIKEDQVINGQGEHWRLHYHHMHLAALLHVRHTHDRAQAHIPTLYSLNNQKLLPLAINRATY